PSRPQAARRSVPPPPSHGIAGSDPPAPRHGRGRSLGRGRVRRRVLSPVPAVAGALHRGARVLARSTPPPAGAAPRPRGCVPATTHAAEPSALPAGPATLHRGGRPACEAGRTSGPVASAAFSRRDDQPLVLQRVQQLGDVLRDLLRRNVRVLAHQPITQLFEALALGRRQLPGPRTDRVQPEVDLGRRMQQNRAGRHRVEDHARVRTRQLAVYHRVAHVKRVEELRTNPLRWGGCIFESTRRGHVQSLPTRVPYFGSNRLPAVNVVYRRQDQTSSMPRSEPNAPRGMKTDGYWIFVDRCDCGRPNWRVRRKPHLLRGCGNPTVPWSAVSSSPLQLARLLLVPLHDRGHAVLEAAGDEHVQHSSAFGGSVHEVVRHARGDAEEGAAWRVDELLTRLEGHRPFDDVEQLLVRLVGVWPGSIGVWVQPPLGDGVAMRGLPTSRLE